jgi:hypothetical protein
MDKIKNKETLEKLPGMPWSNAAGKNIPRGLTTKAIKKFR